MELSKKLKEQGWHLTEDGLKRVASESTDMRKIIAAALDMDFRDIAGGALPTKKEDTLPGRIVLQVQKVHNISAPKANEESKAAPRLLQLELSDGQTTLQALELETVPALSLNVPPGTKIYFRAERLQLMQGFLVLRNSELQVLGGRVEAMAEKWELARAMQQYARAGRRISGTSGPPPWIAFGKKIEALKDTPQDRNFKSLQAAAEKDKEVKENEEFNAMRSEAIAEATKAGAKKVFGGGGQQILDHNVKKILEKGYSEEEAKIALRNTNNNLERALYNLKRRQDYNHSDERQDHKPFSRGAMPREMGGKRGAATAREEADAARPAANVSLFDFLTDKLPANVDAAPNTSRTQVAASNSAYSSATQKYEKPKSDAPKSSYNSASKPIEVSASSTRPKFENNISSSFAANRGPPRNNRAGDFVERNERNPFNTDRHVSPTNSRYSSSRGGGPGKSGGRGGFTAGGSRAPYEDAGNRNYPPASNVDNERGARYSNTSARGSNRGSHERSCPQEVTGLSVAANGAYDNKRSNERSRGGAERYGSSNENRNYDKNRYNQRDNSSRTYDGNRPQSSSNNNGTPVVSASAPITNNYNMNKLVESTSKLKIDKPREQQPAGGNNRHQQQQSQRQRQSASIQQQQQQQQPPKQYSPNQQPLLTPPPAQYIAAAQHSHGAYSQLPNGYTYDSSKIIGFQSKETNEFAMTLLKSQEQQQQAPPATIAQPHAYIPGASPYGTSAAPAYVLPSPPLPQAPMPNQFGMVSVSADGWLWKIGDLCLAKYWDDGRYYEAEITGVSDKTCVVFFLSYGNHEEVLKSDCLPITDVNHCPINSYAQVMPAPPPQQQQLSMQANAFQRGGGGGGGPQRYRGERQMYVPPHKREN